jgi:multisubunit Na+/H+ antiporter MnhB subunit
MTTTQPPIKEAHRMRISAPARATLRDAARLGLLITTVQLAPELLFGVWAWLAAENSADLGLVQFLAPGVLVCLAAAAAFAALDRPHRGRSIAAAGAGVVFSVAVLVSGWVTTSPALVPMSLRLVGLTALVLPVCLLVYVLLGTRHRVEPGADAERHRWRLRSPWMHTIALPLTVLAVLWSGLNIVLPGPGIDWIGLTFSAGLLYALMRHRARGDLTGPAWSSVALLITLPLLPGYVVLNALTTDDTTGQPPTTTIVLGLVGGLIAACWRQGRDRRQSSITPAFDRPANDDGQAPVGEAER